ncbi:MAG: hypothetical protein LBB59_03685 [Campylobacteraceae bacterium]|jgi:hypothetical protein|nr:hypothetical protein [Campylobacteraceae bacterium]
MNNMTNDIIKMSSAIVETGYDILEGLKRSDISLLEKAIEQLAVVDINANKIDNKIISSMPLLCKNESSARELVSYFRIVSEFVQTARVLRYFCRYVLTYTNGHPFMTMKEYILNIFQLSIDAFMISAQLVEKRAYIDDIFRQVKTKQAAGRELFAKLEKNIMEFDIKYTLNCTRVLNAAEKLDEVFKAAVSVVKVILLIQDCGKLRIC